MLVTASRARSYEICASTCRFPCFHVMFPVDVLTDGGCGPDLRSFYSQVHGDSARGWGGALLNSEKQALKFKMKMSFKNYFC